jgi:hypothetical protein
MTHRISFARFVRCSKKRSTSRPMPRGTLKTEIEDSGRNDEVKTESVARVNELQRGVE